MPEQIAISRRAAITGASVAAAAASVPALAAGAHPDAELLGLKPGWVKLHAAFYATFDPLAEAEDRCWPLLTRGMSGADRAVVERNTGLTSAKDAQRQACEAELDIVWQIFSLPAVTRDGLRFKRRLLKEWEGSVAMEWRDSFQADLLRLAGIDDD